MSTRENYMKIEPQTLRLLYDKYKESFVADYEKPQNAFNQAFQAIEEQLIAYFNWDSLSQEDVLNPELVSLLKQAVQINNKNTLQFDELNTELSCNAFAQQFHGVFQLKLANRPSEQGIQEKFLKTELKEDNVLTELDIQRHIVLTDMQGHIGVVDRNVEAMGLYIANARLNHKQHEPLNPPHRYPIAMMVNCNPEGDAKWAAVFITIDPDKTQASYSITIGPNLEVQTSALVQLVHEAIQFTKKSSVTGFPIESYPNINISAPKITRVEDSSFYVLHDLYKNEALTDLVEERDNANKFKNVTGDSVSIRQAVTEQQIQSIKIEPELFNIFEMEHKPQHPLVSDAIQDTKLTDNKITFPRVEPEQPLTGQDYQIFILLLKEKFDAVQLDISLNELEIKCFDIAALQGLAQLKGLTARLPFEKLILGLPTTVDKSDKATFKFNLKLSLMSLSHSNLAKLELKDESNLFDEADITEITHFIVKNNIAIDLTLPGDFASSTNQKDIDNATSQFILNRNAQNFSNRNNAVQTASITRPIRTRPELASTNLSIDVEVQQEVQQQVQVEVEASVEKESGVKEENDDIDLFSLERFIAAIQNGNQFSPDSRSYLIPGGSKASNLWGNWLGNVDDNESHKGMQISKPALEEIMRHTDKFQYGVGFIRQGDEYRNLPAGFIVKKKNKQVYLDFNPKLKLIADQNALTVQTKDAKASAILSTAQIDKWLETNPTHPFKAEWEQQLSNPPYSKQIVQALKTTLPQIAQMPVEQVEKLFGLCKTKDQIDITKLNFLVHDAGKAQRLFNLSEKKKEELAFGLKHYINTLFDPQHGDVISYITNFSTEEKQNLLNQLLNDELNTLVERIQIKINTININILLQLYLQSGSKGLEELNQLLNNANEATQNDYKRIINSISTNEGSYQQILSDEFNNAIHTLSGLIESERLFFFKMFEQHCHYNSNVNFAELVNSFVQFNLDLRSLARPGQAFTLPLECNLTKVKSMPLALSRIVALVRHVRQEDRQAQLSEAHTLDLSSRGIIQAITRHFDSKIRWNFITQEMQLNYKPADEKQKADIYKNNTKWKDLTGEDNTLSEAFFRYVAFQSKKGSLSLNFYKHVDQKTQPVRWSNETKILFYKIIAASTTTEANTQFTRSTEDAIKDFDVFFDKINAPPNPGYFAYALMGGPDNIRKELLETLKALKHVPPLPVLSRLVTLISNSFSSVFAVASNREKLDTANQRLRDMTEIYQSYVYNGLSCYNNNDYKTGSLFFEHMETIQAIHDYSTSPENTDDSSENDRNRHNPYKPAFSLLLIRLISTFHLKTATKSDNSLTPIITTFDTLQGLGATQKIMELLSLLDKIDSVKYLNLPPLNHDHLISLMNQYAQSEHAYISDFIKSFNINEHKLSEYFDPLFLQNYGKGRIPDKTKQKIDGCFDEQTRPSVETILLRFTDKNAPNHYDTVVDKLVTIFSGLNKLEQNLFITKLSQAQGLYSNLTKLEDPDNDFMQLLNLLEEQGSPDELLNLIASDTSLLARLPDAEDKENVYTGEPSYNQGLDKKAVYLIKDIYPAIKQNQGLPFTRLEITPRLHEWLLRTPAAQLKKDSEVTHADTEITSAYLTHSATFLGTMKETGAVIALNLKDLDNALNELPKLSNVPNKETIAALQKDIARARSIPDNRMALAFTYTQNPPAKKLLSYFDGSIAQKEKDKFEKIYGTFIKKNLEQHPDLNNKALLAIATNYKNAFLNNALKNPSLTALRSSDLLSNEATFNTFLTGLEKDVQSVKQLQESVSRIHQEVEEYQNGLKHYPNVVLSLIDKMTALVNENSSARGQFLELFDKFVEYYKPAHGEMMLALHAFVDQLTPVFAMIEDKNVVLSLCVQFNGDEGLGPDDLIRLIETIEPFSTENKKLLINVAVNLINNKKGYTLGQGNNNDFTALCNLAKSHPHFIETLNKFYNKPPYPNLKQIIDIHNQANKQEPNEENDYLQKIQELVTTFDIKPCHREEDNKFDVEEAVKHLELFEGYKASREDLTQFFAKTQSMRDKTSQELLAILKNFHPDSQEPNEDLQILVAVATELFYRSQGKDIYTESGGFKLGSSMEINTTQYLAILSSLETKGHVTSQIGTGEGKSRIMMISNVCQWALGNTVDFVTSDAQLATRDYVEYQAYFNMVGAETSMVFANSDTSSYKIRGINFSDPSNLSLFRNKAKSHGKGDKVLDPVETRRALMLDEADKTYFDVADTRFNFSKEGDESIQDMGWVYPILMEYFEQESVPVDSSINNMGTLSPQQLFYTHVDASRESFLAFANSRCFKQDSIRLKALPEQQIEQWQVSAITARQLQFKKDFVIAPDQLIATPRGPKISSEAQLLFANRVAKGSKLSFGVHQCLHAHLNRFHQNQERISNPDLREALETCEQGFYVADEKQIVYSSTSKNLIDDYKKGTLKAVTGTAGSLLEKVEAHLLYNKMTLIVVPRAKGMIRQDKPTQLCNDYKQQLDTLIASIKSAQVKYQPILIITENDDESGKLFTALKEHFPEDVQRIHSQLSSKEEKDLIKIAGIPKKITVSTNIIGRGIDIELRTRTLSNGLQVSAEENGLNVMVTYLPRVRDLQQIIGRSGRFGAKGESSLILDTSRLLTKLDMKKPPREFKEKIDILIRLEQGKMDRKAQVVRLLKNHIGDFKRELQLNFVDKMLAVVPNHHKKDLVGYWTQFFEKSDKAWNEVWPHVQQQLQQHNITMIELTQIETLLNQYKEATQKEWSTLMSKVSDLDITCLNHRNKAHELLKPEIPDLTLNETLKGLALMEGGQEKIDNPAQRHKIILGSTAGAAGIGLGMGLLTLFFPPAGLSVIAAVTMIASASTLAGGLIGGVSAALVTAPPKRNRSEEPNQEVSNTSSSSYTSIIEKIGGKQAPINSEQAPINSEQAPNAREVSLLKQIENPPTQTSQDDVHNRTHGL